MPSVLDTCRVRLDLNDREAAARPLTRVVRDWNDSERAFPPPRAAAGAVQEAVQTELQGEFRRARRAGRVAWGVVLLLVATGGLTGWKFRGEIAQLRQERAVMLSQVSERQVQLDRQTRTDDRAQLDLKALRQDMAASAQSLTTLRGENERLRQEAEEANRRLRDAGQREEQARTRWAYAEGERDALQAQLTALTSRLEGMFQAASERARMATMNPPGELFGPSPPTPEAAPAPSPVEPPATSSPSTS